MPLANAVQYSRKRLQTITWEDEGGTPIDLTNATLLGVIERPGADPVLITGALVLVTAASGIFSWAYSAADVASAGAFYVQFYARYSADSSKPEMSFKTKWHVLPSFEFPFVSPSVSPSGSSSASASDSA